MSTVSTSRSRIAYLTRIAVLLAIVFVLTVFNIGNIPVGPIVATIYQVPVIIGAVMLGTLAGTILGGVWGLLCFYLAVTGQTTDVVALATIQQNVFLYFVIAFVPRLLTGFLSGLLAQGLKKSLPAKFDFIGFGITGAVGSLCNTFFYLGSLYVFIKNILAEVYNIDISAVSGLVIGVATTNGLAEALLSLVIVTAVCKALSHLENFRKS